MTREKLYEGDVIYLDADGKKQTHKIAKDKYDRVKELLFSALQTGINFADDKGQLHNVPSHRVVWTTMTPEKSKKEK